MRIFTTTVGLLLTEVPEICGGYSVSRFLPKALTLRIFWNYLRLP